MAKLITNSSSEIRVREYSVWYCVEELADNLSLLLAGYPTFDNVSL